VLHDSALTIGLGVGDSYSSVCVLDSLSGEVLEESRVATRPAAIERFFARQPASRVALEVGTHSPWLARIVEAAGHDTIVANAYQVRLVHGTRRKNDRIDAEKLARLARFDVHLLKPVQHRSARAHADLARLKARDALVHARTNLVLHVRGIVKTTGSRLPSGSVDAFHQRARAHLPDELVPTRFGKGREVGPYLGLTPGQQQSGDRDVATGITKQGDAYLRRLLVQCAQHILHKGPDSDLKRAGVRLKERGAHTNKAVTAIVDGMQPDDPSFAGQFQGRPRSVVGPGRRSPFFLQAAGLLPIQPRIADVARPVDFDLQVELHGSIRIQRRLGR